MTTQYQEDFENVVNATLEELCEKYRSPELKAGFEIFAVAVIWNAHLMRPHIPTRLEK